MRLLAPALLAFAVGGTAWAEEPRAPASFEVDVDVVSVTAVVHDDAGRFVSGLGPSDIELYEDGVRQEVSYFRAARGGEAKIPLSVVLVLDTSGSMRRNLRFLQEAALSFVRKLEPSDVAMVVDFNESVRGSAEFTNNVERLERFVGGLSAWGGTSLHDALHYALERVREQAGRRALIVFSDGGDTTSTLGEREVLEYARATEATIYCVGMKGDRSLFARSPTGFLKKLARESGGSFFFPGRVGELIRIFSAISEELHNHYLLGYTPSRKADGSWRQIKVKVLRPGVHVRVRHGYFALKRRPIPTPPPGQ
jgi:Ca-activated chloride channel family protein